MIELDVIQKEIAYKPYNSRQLIVAGPGTGKTELVAQRILYLIDAGGLQPENLLALSFSRSAVKTLSNRLHSLGPLPAGLVESLRHLSIRTFDSWTFRILRFLGHSATECLNRGYDANIELLSRTLKEKGHEMLQDDHICKLHRIKHIIVDEVQDISGVRAELVLSLLDLVCNISSKDKGFTLLGDENQAIYDFAYRETRKGITALKFLQEIRCKWGSNLIESELTHNYRCEPSIDALIIKAADILKKSRSQGQNPLPALQKLLDEVKSTDLRRVLEDDTDKSTAILCRNNGQALFQAAILLADLQAGRARKFKVHAGDSPVRLPYWIGVLLSFYKAKTTLTKNIVHEIYNALAKRGIKIPYKSDRLWDMMCKIMQEPEDASISLDRLISRLRWPDSLPDDEYEEEIGLLLLTTVHQSKGKEFDNVLILRDGVAEDKQDNCDVAEEGRLAYVAISRARKNLSSIVDDPDVKLSRRSFDRGSRERWHGFKFFQEGKRKRYYNYLEIGVSGDVDEYSFVDPLFHGGEEEVKKLQLFLANEAPALSGEKVLLKKRFMEEDGIWKVYYDIYLQRPTDEHLLGACGEQLGKDLAYLRKDKNLSLPSKIEGLRISQVFSFIRNGNERGLLAEPFNSTGIWLCVSIHGIGQYEYYYGKRRG